MIAFVFLNEPCEVKICHCCRIAWGYSTIMACYSTIKACYCMRGGRLLHGCTKKSKVPLITYDNHGELMALEIGFA